MQDVTCTVKSNATRRAVAIVFSRMRKRVFFDESERWPCAKPAACQFKRYLVSFSSRLMAPNQKTTSQIITFNRGCLACLLDTTHQLILQQAKYLWKNKKKTGACTSHGFPFLKQILCIFEFIDLQTMLCNAVICRSEVEKTIYQLTQHLLFATVTFATDKTNLNSGTFKI